MKVLFELFAAPGVTQDVVPIPGMSIARVVTRDQLKEALRAKGLITSDHTAPLTSTERSRLRDVPAALERKGFIGMTDRYIWLLTTSA